MSVHAAISAKTLVLETQSVPYERNLATIRNLQFYAQKRKDEGGKDAFQWSRSFAKIKTICWFASQVFRKLRMFLLYNFMITETATSAFLSFEIGNNKSNSPSSKVVTNGVVEPLETDTS